MIGDFTLMVITGLSHDCYTLGIRTSIHDGWPEPDSLAVETATSMDIDTSDDTGVHTMAELMGVLSDDQGGDDIRCIIEYRDADGDPRRVEDFASYYPDDGEADDN